METDVMSPSTTSGGTRETEPEVWAAISSAEGNPELPKAIHAEGRALSLGGMMLLLAAGIGLGYCAARRLGSRR